jgi:hypothetical protein
LRLLRADGRHPAGCSKRKTHQERRRSELVERHERLESSKERRRGRTAAATVGQRPLIAGASATAGAALPRGFIAELKRFTTTW